MPDFVLNWVTPSSILADVVEAQTVRAALEVGETLTVEGREGQYTLTLGDAISRVTELRIGGVLTDFVRQRTDGLIYWEGVLPEPKTIVVTLTPNPVYTLLNGSLPPGLSLSPAGVITGKIGNVSGAPFAYRFTVRVSNGQIVLDRVFSIRVTPLDEPVAINPSQLRPVSTDTEDGFTYRNLGGFNLGETFSMTLDILTTPGQTPLIEIQSVDGLTEGSTRFAGLPPGLRLNERTIAGTIDPESCAGRYFFDVVVRNGSTSTSGRFMIEVDDRVATTVSVTQGITWDTPEGSLGSVFETEACTFFVRARPRISATVLYSLAPGSAALPTGVTLNQITGNLYGSFPYVASNTVYTFVVRATVGRVFADRTFSFTVKKVYDIKNTHTLRLRVRALDDAQIVPAYKLVLGSEVIYRPEDNNFGNIIHPYVYLISGLDGTVDLADAMAGQGVETITNRDYHATIRLTLGQHKVALARDSQGKVIYEVLYRELYDPQAKAGGFKVAFNQPTRQNVLWPQSGPDPRYIMPVSLDNMRTDMIVDVGFAMRAAADRTLIGSASPELMPLWMRSKQENGETPGYRPALVLAYLVPGSSAAVLKKIRQNEAAFVSDGHVYQFDRYYTTLSQVAGAIDEAIHLE